MGDNRPLTSKEKKQLSKQRKAVAKEAQKFHKEQSKKAKRSSEKSAKKTQKSKIAKAVNERKEQNKIDFAKISREEKYIRESNEKIRNLEPKDFDDGYYIDEYGEKQRRDRRAKEIHNQENEVLSRRKKPVTSKQLKIRRILIYTGILLVVLVIGAILSLTVLFKTEKIEIEGNEYYYDDQITAFCNVQLQQNIFLGAMNSTPGLVSENLPYVESAAVYFTIPDTITIKLVNAVPSYVIKDNGKYLVISGKGRILCISDSNEDKLPELSCGKLTTTEVGKYVAFEDKNIPDILEQIVNSLNENKVENIVGFDVSDTSNITLDYDGRIKINIGLPQDIDYKIRTATTIINKNLDPNNTKAIKGTLDVSACNTTKISHYKPYESTVPSTAPSTEPTTADGVQNNEPDYTWSGDQTYQEPTQAQGDYLAEPQNSYQDDPQNDYGYQDGIQTATESYYQ